MNSLNKEDVLWNLSSAAANAWSCVRFWPRAEKLSHQSYFKLSEEVGWFCRDVSFWVGGFSLTCRWEQRERFKFLYELNISWSHSGSEANVMLACDWRVFLSALKITYPLKINLILSGEKAPSHQYMWRMKHTPIFSHFIDVRTTRADGLNAQLI